MEQTPQPPNKAKLIQVLQMIQDDAETNAHRIDGSELTGFVLGSNFGNIYAAIVSLARVLEQHLVLHHMND